MTLLTLLQSTGEAPPPPPPPATGGGRDVVRRPVVVRRPAPPPLQVRAFAPGVAILVAPTLVTSKARGAAAAPGFQAAMGAGRLQPGAARGAARARGTTLQRGAVAKAGAPRVEPRLSFDEFAALLLAAR